MDIYCPKCREPWDMDEIHEAISERYPNRPWEKKGAPGSRERQKAYEPYYEAMKKEFYREGCGIFGTTCSAPAQGRSVLLDELYDALGDDLDGLASEMEDFGIQEMLFD